jgi:hypothetical protein
VSPRPPLNYRDAAAYIGKSERWMRNNAADAGIPVTQVGGEIRFIPEVLDEYLIAHTTGLDDELREFVRRTRAASGVPETVEDPTALAAVGTLLTNAAPVQPRRRPRGRRAVE